MLTAQTLKDTRTLPRADLETIIAQLYPIFGQRRTKYRNESSLMQKSSAQPESSRPALSQEEDIPQYQDILSWLDGLSPSPAQEPAGETEVGNEAVLEVADVKYSQPVLSFYSKSEYFQNILDNIYSDSRRTASQPLGEYKGRLAGRLDNQLSAELGSAIKTIQEYTSAARAIRRQDKLDVVPRGRAFSDGFYSLDLKVGGSSLSAHYAEKTLMRVKTSAGVETIEIESGSTIAKAYHALDDKGLVGIFEKSERGAIELKEVLGLDGAKLDLAEGPGGNISISYHQPEHKVSDFEYINRELVLNPESRNHGYDFIRPVEVTHERAADSSTRLLRVINGQGREEQYEVRNNSAIAIMADAISESGYTPEIQKMDVLSNDGTRIESGIYIKNAYKTNSFGQKQALITDTSHGGMWVELSQGSSRSEFVDPAGCSLNLERATPMAGQVIEARLGIVGRYDNRNYE